MHWGLTAGYLEAKGEDIAPGSIESRFQVPFVGGYAVATYGSFFADVLVRREFYNVTLNQPTSICTIKPWAPAAGRFRPAPAITSISATDGSSSHPAGVIWSRTEVDPFAFGGPVNIPIAGTIGRSTISRA